MSSAGQESTVLYFFCYVMINEILPFEAKYISLRKYKEFNLVREIIILFLQEIFKNSNEAITIEDFKSKYGNKIDNILRDYKAEYALLLIKSFMKELDPYKNVIKEYAFKRNGKLYLDGEKIDELIDFIEEKLGISNKIVSDRQLRIPGIVGHINANIYQKDLELLKNKIKKFHKYFNCLEKELEESGFLQKQDKIPDKDHEKTLKDIEYLYLVVLHEFWNFLAHFSKGLVFFNSPQSFIANIKKSISHLKRAIMDIFDGIIIEKDCSFQLEYLRLRVIKLASLGESKKIQKLIEDLEEMFCKCVEDDCCGKNGSGSPM